MITIASLFVHPIKSAAGLAVTRARLSPFGFVDDRRFMVVDATTGAFLSQRRLPRMVLAQPQRHGETLHVHAPGMPTLQVPCVPSGDARRVQIWDDTCDATDCGDAAAAWWSTFLAHPSRLVFMPESTVRRVSPTYAAPSDQVSFADGFPFLLASQASLQDLKARLGEHVGIERFRANIVITGALPWAEDGWGSIIIAGIPFVVAKPCARCSIITVDPTTGTPGAEPLRTLATYRKRDNKVYFGQNLIHRGEGLLQVGDEVTVVE